MITAYSNIFADANLIEIYHKQTFWAVQRKKKKILGL
uniref:Uncharacterized protein n=1 Tax=Rhizophora mucronata TaxID=61149 RepID=A0A2P2N8K3_RHIMU